MDNLSMHPPYNDPIDVDVQEETMKYLEHENKDLKERIAALEAETARLKAELSSMRKCAEDISLKKSIQIEALEAKNAKLKDERSQDVLDGQAALDEANNEIARLRSELDEARKPIAALEAENAWLKNELLPLRVDYVVNKRKLARIDALLPDDLYPGSKDWTNGDAAERIEWLRVGYEAKKAEADEAWRQLAKAQETSKKLRTALKKRPSGRGCSPSARMLLVVSGWSCGRRRRGIWKLRKHLTI
ncbi:MAG: hypothetical protein SVK08_01735 [Halobacteriota archaeon]|nr:hypothetical protein [Halobacteriota archaeon]